jgi:hypothetical protein
MPDWLKLALGPPLAILPVLVWELIIKPARVRRNVALLVKAEIELNLAWLMRFALAREDDAELLTATRYAPTAAFEGNMSVLAELPEATLRHLMLFYTRLREVEGIIDTLNGLFRERSACTDPARLAWLRVVMPDGFKRLDIAMNSTIRRGNQVRGELHTAASDASITEVAPLLPLEQLVRDDL